MANTLVKRVGSHGVEIKGHRYYCPKLQGWQGKLIRLSFDPMQPERIQVYDSDKNLICEATCPDFDPVINPKSYPWKYAVVAKWDGQHKRIRFRCPTIERAEEMYDWLLRNEPESIPEIHPYRHAQRWEMSVASPELVGGA